MKREEILEKSRRENKGGDAWEADVLAQAGKIAVQAGLLLCCLTAVLEVTVTGKVSMGSWTIYFGMLTTLFAVKYRKMRKRHELAMTILYGGLFVMFLTLFIRNLVR
jgi:hypothetical protein